MLPRSGCTSSLVLAPLVPAACREMWKPRFGLYWNTTSSLLSTRRTTADMTPAASRETVPERSCSVCRSSPPANPSSIVAGTPKSCMAWSGLRREARAVLSFAIATSPSITCLRSLTLSAWTLGKRSFRCAPLHRTYSSSVPLTSTSPITASGCGSPPGTGGAVRRTSRPQPSTPPASAVRFLGSWYMRSSRVGRGAQGRRSRMMPSTLRYWTP
mmetsp:Transcript_51129/g.120178  ORF Transcript_51129/g.120178 Transcript_51129/m.120178 type:complete len:214 (+) Transcript_51129:544-1185(+)